MLGFDRRLRRPPLHRGGRALRAVGLRWSPPGASSGAETKSRHDEPDRAGVRTSGRTEGPSRREAVMRRVLLGATIVSLLVLGSASSGGAATGQHFRAHLTGEAERPTPRDTRAVGQANLALSEDGTTLVCKLIASNIDNVVQAHIHLGTAEVAGPIVAFLYGPVAAAGRPGERRAVDHGDHRRRGQRRSRHRHRRANCSRRSAPAGPTSTSTPTTASTPPTRALATSQAAKCAVRSPWAAAGLALPAAES